jgi:uncharacterized protein (TIGR03435 family)
LGVPQGQKLLTERFHIGLHRETKEVAVYRLTIAKNGSKLNPPEPIPHYDTEEEWSAATKKQRQESLKDLSERQAIGERGSRGLGFASASTEKFANTLSGYLDRPVKDATHLEGNYSFHLHWVIPKDASYEGPGPDIFAAVQEQLGLKLEPAKDFLEWLILDKIDKAPAEN